MATSVSTKDSKGNKMGLWANMPERSANSSGMLGSTDWLANMTGTLENTLDSMVDMSSSGNKVERLVSNSEMSVSSLATKDCS